MKVHRFTVEHKGRVYEVIVDQKDAAEVQRHRWYLHVGGGHSGNKPYVCRKRTPEEAGSRNGHLRLHRLLVNAPPGMTVDHKNGNTLDNRRANLEVVTGRENTKRYHRRRKRAKS